MSIKSFLQEKGFIEKEAESKGSVKEQKSQSVGPDLNQEQVEPTYFPLHGDIGNESSSSVSSQPATSASGTPSPGPERIDQAFVKFFEDELLRTNFPGPDYFEFRKQMLAMHEKIGKKGTPPEVILQAVLTSFEAQSISSSKLIDTAKQYKQILSNKKNDFLKGAAVEKDNQYQKRQTALQNHQNNLNQMQGQLQQLQKQMSQLQDMIKKEQTQTEVDKTLGKEGIEKIEKAEKQISLAYDFMINAIDADINQLQSA
jgi:hypothetical protein